MSLIDSIRSRHPVGPQTDTPSINVYNTATGLATMTAMVKTDNNSPGNHRVKLSFGRPKQVCHTATCRWFTGVILFYFFFEIRHSEFECRQYPVRNVIYEVRRPETLSIYYYVIYIFFFYIGTFEIRRKRY